MNYQFNNSIVIILVIYVLSFYQINCDKETTISNSSVINISSSSTNQLKPDIIGSEDTQKSGTVKKYKANTEVVSESSEQKPATGLIPKNRRKNFDRETKDVNITNTLTFRENDMVATSEKTIVLKERLGDTVELGKINTTSVETKTTTTPTPPPPSKTTIPVKSKKPISTVFSSYLNLELPTKLISTKPAAKSSSNTTINNDVQDNSTKPSNSVPSSTTTTPLHSVEEIEMPKVQFSKEQIPIIRSKHDYVIPVVALIFAIPIILAIATIMYRRAKDYWETRHYRRMDFLIDEMYND